MARPPELLGPRLSLRPLAGDDETHYCSVYTDAELMRLVATPLSLAAARRAFAAARKANCAGNLRTAYWTLFERERRVRIGLLGMVGAPDGSDAEVGAMILARWRSRGYAAEAIAELARYAFTTLPLTRLHTRHEPGNGAAIGLMHRLGFERAADAGEGVGQRWELLRENWQLRASRES